MINMNRLVYLVVFSLSVLSCMPEGSTKRIDRWIAMDGTVVRGNELEVCGNDTVSVAGEYRNFILKGKAYTDKDAEASIMFHSDGKSGYEVLFRNGPVDGTRKSGSLAAVRNLYRSLAEDEEWFDFEIAVRGRNITVGIGGTDVVCYTEPEAPYRTEDYSDRVLGSGRFFIQGGRGCVRFRDVVLTELAADAKNENDTLPPVDERTDAIIRLQQKNFPVIDYHVHLKGGLT